MRDTILRSFLYPAPSYPVPAPAAGLEEVWLPLLDADPAHGWFDGGPGGEGKAALVILHGNGENLGTMAAAGLFQELQSLGVPFLAVDYPGYGRSPGQPSESGNIAAAVAAVDHLAERFPEARLGIWGWSLGAAVGLQAAVHRQDRLATLTLLSPWTSLAEVARRHFPHWLVKSLVSERYDSLAAARALDVPTLVLHGADDTLIPVEHGRELSEALLSLDRWVPVPGAGHNDLLNHRIVWRTIGEFLSR